MNKLIAYLVAVAGLILMALSLMKVFSIPGIQQVFITLTGVILVVVGVFLSIGNKYKFKEKQSEKEVPIYAGTGKHRKIVGYKREE